MRPVYETPSDLKREESLRVELGRALGGELVKLPKQYGVDWALIDANHNVTRWVELKTRNVAHNYYSTYFISLGKVQRAMQLQRDTGIGALLVVEFVDGVYTLPFDQCYGPPMVIRMGGRWDRIDWQDIEPMVHINTGRMTLIEGVIPRGGNGDDIL